MSSLCGSVHRSPFKHSTLIKPGGRLSPRKIVLLLNPNYRWTEQREGAHTSKNVGRKTWPFTAAHYVASHNKSFMNKDNAAMHNTLTATVRVCACACL